MEKKKTPRGRKEPDSPAGTPVQPDWPASAAAPEPGSKSAPAPAAQSQRLNAALQAASAAPEDKLRLPPEDVPDPEALRLAGLATPEKPAAAGQRPGNTIAELLFERAELEALAEDPAGQAAPAPAEAPKTPAAVAPPPVAAQAAPPAPVPPKPAAPAPAAAARAASPRSTTPAAAPAPPPAPSSSSAPTPTPTPTPTPAPAPAPAPAPVSREVPKPAEPVAVRSSSPTPARAAAAGRGLQGPSLALGLAVGVLAAAIGFWAWTAFGPLSKAAALREAAHAEEIKKLQAELETARFEASNLRTGSRNLSLLLNAFSTDWDKPPERPRYQKTPDGVLIFWEDQMIWRKYYLYQGKGDQGRMTRYNARPLKRPFVYLANPAPGIYRFSLSALNKEGKETLPGEVLSLRLPLD